MTETYFFTFRQSHKAMPSSALALTNNRGFVGWNTTEWNPVFCFAKHIPSVTQEHKITQKLTSALFFVIER